MELGPFKEWLIKERGLKAASAKDVVSRLRRIDKIDINIDDDYGDICLNLDENEVFNDFSVFVKPQIKRAIKLYKEFKVIKG